MAMGVPTLSFNSRTREGCDFSKETNLSFALVSIHAPGRGATVGSRKLLSIVIVSIHAPGRGATSPFSVRAVVITSVSIHAPGRGATSGCIKRLSASDGFNSRTREGCDRDAIRDQGYYYCFNSRTREGCDPSLPPHRRI